MTTAAPSRGAAFSTRPEAPKNEAPKSPNKTAAAVSVLEPLALSALPSDPLVSVLVGNYNYANYIGQAIDSVLKQTYSRWELIVCDDGSTDGSAAIIEGYRQRDERIRLLRKGNGGHTSALNAAFAECRGEIICLLDSDDLYAPNKLERAVAAFAEEPETGLLIHRVIRTNKERQAQGVWPLSDALPGGWLGPELLLRAGGVLPYAPPTSGIGLRREAAAALFPLTTAPPLHTCPDQVIARLAPLLTRLKRLPDCLAEYRLHDANTYSQRRVTADSVQRELDLSGALWSEQRRFLAARDRGLAEQFSSLENSSHTALLRYLLAKLRRQPSARRERDGYLRACAGQRHWSWLLVWRLSLYLPPVLFERTINALLGQGAIKQFVARLKTRR